MREKTNPEMIWDMIAECAESIDFNMNDVFSFASADAESIDINDIQKVYQLYRRYGRDGIYAFASYKREQEMIAILKDENCHQEVTAELQTNNYKQAKKQLQEEQYKISS
jgi:molybdopterin-guanine dinucleotide biosynthesis protein A